MKTIKLPNFKSKIHISDEKPSKALIILTAVVLFVYFVTTYYVDNPTIFLSAVWRNKGITQYSLFYVFMTPELPYGLLHQWICQIWVLPINIANTLFGVAIDGLGAFLWYKTFTVVCFLLVLKELDQLAKECGIEQNKVQWMNLLFTTSLLVAMPVFHIAQTDMLYIFFMLIAVRAYLQKQHWKFLLLFAIAIPMKYLPIFAFIPLVLMAEKRFFYIARDLFVGVSGVIIEKVVCFLADKYVKIETIKNNVENSVGNIVADTVQKVSETKTSAVEVKSSFVSHFINKTLYFEIPAVRKGMSASILLILFFILCIWCYLQYQEDNDEWKRKCIYTIFTGLLIYFILGTPTPYWIVLLYPFLMLMIFMNSSCIRINLLLQLLFTGTMFYLYIVDTSWVYGGSVTFDYMLLNYLGITKELHVYDEGPNVLGYLTKFGLDQFVIYATSLVIALVIGLLYINNTKVRCQEQINQKSESYYMRNFSYFQIGILIIWYVVNLLLVANLI